MHDWNWKILFMWLVLKNAELCKINRQSSELNKLHLHYKTIITIRLFTQKMFSLQWRQAHKAKATEVVKNVFLVQFFVDQLISIHCERDSLLLFSKTFFFMFSTVWWFFESEREQEQQSGIYFLCNKLDDLIRWNICKNRKLFHTWKYFNSMP